MYEAPDTLPTWLAPTDPQGIADFMEVYHEWGPLLSRKAAAADREFVSPAGVRAQLEEALRTGGWPMYEALLREHSRRAGNARVPFSQLETAYGRLLGDLAPLVVRTYGDATRRQIGAMDVLVRLVRYEISVLSRAYHSGSEPTPQTEPNFGAALDILGDGVIATDRDGRAVIQPCATSSR